MWVRGSMDQFDLEDPDDLMDLVKLYDMSNEEIKGYKEKGRYLSINNMRRKQ